MENPWSKFDPDDYDNIPTDREIMLWLKAPQGETKQIGQVIAKFVDNDFFFGWAEKSVANNINTGLPQELITHWKELDNEIPT